jgi:plasmid maintenance system antidote protein VapI
MGISYKLLNHILNERRSLTPATAMIFEAVLGIDAGLLMRMQLKYNMRVTRQDKIFLSRLAEIRKTAAAL